MRRASMCSRVVPIATIVFLSALSADIAQAVPLPTRFGDLDVVRALDEMQRGEADKAYRRLAAHLQHTPHPWPETRFFAARAALAAGLPNEALAALFTIDGEGAKAIPSTKGGAAHAPDSMPEVRDYIWALRAQAYRAKGRWREASDAWRRVLEVQNSPLHPQARFGLADAAFARGDLDSARRAYEDAINSAKYADEAMTARYNLGRIAEMQGRWADAAEYYRYLAYRYPSHPLHEPAQERLSFLARTGLGPEPTLAQKLYRIDRLLSARSLEDAEAALHSLRDSVRRQGDRQAVDYRLAQLAYRQREYQSALQLFKSLLRSTSDLRRRLEYESWLARTYSAASRYDEAIEVHLGIAARQENASAARQALFKAAWLAYNGGNHALAMDLFGRFIHEHPKDSSTVDALWYYAWNAYRLGKLNTARDSLTSLRRRFPQSSLAQRATYWEGRIAMTQGNVQGALGSFQSVLKQRPNDYYAALASQRIRELGDHPSRSRPVATLGVTLGRDELFGNQDPVPSPDALSGGLQPAPDELPLSGGLRGVRMAHVPWGAPAFSWSSPEGKRAVRLMRMGMIHDAAEIVGSLPALPGHASAEVSYARARLLWALGDYNRAYRLVQSTFRDDLEGPITGRARRYFQLAYPTAHWDLVSRAAREFQINPLVILSLMRQESAFDERARSWASANGLMQIIPRTGQKIANALAVDDYNYSILRTPEVNVRFGTWYLSALVKKFHGNLPLAIGSYNAGPVAMASWLDLRPGLHTDEFVEDIPYQETRHYVKRVLGNLVVYAALYDGTSLSIPERIPDGYLDNVNF